MTNLGDFAADQTFDLKFCTVTTTGAPTTLSGTPVISAYIDNNTTQITAGITLSVDFDAVTGLNNVRVVATTANGYTAGSNFQLVITTGTVGGTSVVGYVIGQFSITARAALRPTTTGRTLTVDASGRGLSDIDTIKTNPVVNGGTITFPTTATLASTTNITAGTIATVTNLTNAPTNGDLTAAMKASVNSEVVDAVAVDVIADSVAADGSRPTIAQAVLMINRFLMERSVSTTTMTVKKEDGSTSSMTFTLNSATAPTSITRAS